MRNRFYVLRPLHYYSIALKYNKLDWIIKCTSENMLRYTHPWSGWLVERNPWLCNAPGALMTETLQKTDWQVLENSNHSSSGNGRPTKKFAADEDSATLRLTYGGVWKGSKATLGWQMEGHAHKMKVVDLSSRWRRRLATVWTILLFCLLHGWY